MDRLTRERVEELSSRGLGLDKVEFQQLCDLALQSLSQEAVRDEALEEAAKAIIKIKPRLSHRSDQKELAAETALQAAVETIRALKREPTDQERIYTKADMEAACELALAAYRSKPVLDKMVDRFLAWPLPPSVCSDACVVQRGYPHRIGTNLLTADEARQMLEHVLKREPNAAAQAGPSEITSPSQEGREAGPAPAAPDVASMVKRLRGCVNDRHDPSVTTCEDIEPLALEAAALLLRLGQQVETLQAAHDLGWAHKTCPSCGADMMTGASDE